MDNTMQVLTELRHAVEQGFKDARAETSARFAEVRAAIVDMESRISRLELQVREEFSALRVENAGMKEALAGTREALHRLQKDVLALQEKIHDVQNETNQNFKEMRKENYVLFRWIATTQIAILLAIVGLFARASHLF